MSNVIAFLEKMGQNAQLRHASHNDVKLELARAQIDPELQAAILAKNQQQLEVLLGKGNVCCMLFPTNVRCMLFVDEGEEKASYLEQCA
jgi:hypothetical protein